MGNRIVAAVLLWDPQSTDNRSELRMTNVEDQSELSVRRHKLGMSNTFFNSISSGIVIHDAHGVMVDCNSHAQELLGMDRHEVIGRRPEDEIWGSVDEDFSPLLAENRPSMVALRTGHPCLDVTMGINNPQGPRRWLKVSSYPLIHDQQITGILTWFADATKIERNSRFGRIRSEVQNITPFDATESDVMRTLCGAIVKQCDYSVARVVLAPDTHDVIADADIVVGNPRIFQNTRPLPLPVDIKKPGPVASALQEGVSQVINDLSSELLGGIGWKMVPPLHQGSLLIIPFKPVDLPAVLFVHDRRPYAFDELVVADFKELLKYAELAISRVRSVRLQKSAFAGTIRALGQMTETRDPYTAGHQLSVANLGAAISRRMGLGDDLTELIHISGQVHDIGKISIPAEILTRPGRLSPLEFEMIKEHTTIGANILAEASLPWPIADVALQHHERLDGSGYPFGLTGEEIILPARIIAVADVVEAMTHHRPYRAALGIERALAEVVAGAGLKYDADVVAACVEEFDAGFDFGLP
jgi:PAS domain S-box-containing protein